MVTLFTLGIICLAAVILIPVILFLVGLPFLLLMGLLPWLLRVAGVVLLIKALVALLFTSRAPRLLCPRNGAALLLACLLSPAAYGLAACLLLGGVNAFWPQFLGTLVQAVGSGAVFAVLALALDRAGGKARLAPHSQG